MNFKAFMLSLVCAAVAIIYGIIAVVAGLVLIFSPILGAVTLWILLGASLVVMGLVQIFRAFSIKPAK